MRNNSAIIASNAGFFADILKKKLSNTDLSVFIAVNDADLKARIKIASPRVIFIENCFRGHCTDSFIQRMVKRNRSLHIAVWAACELKPLTAARFIHAGAESYFSLRDTESNIDTIIYRIAGGRNYYPADVEAALDNDDCSPAIGEKLTKRENEIIKLSIDGKRNKEIADVLSISVATVKFHKGNIYRKCGGNKPVDILRNGMRMGVLNPEDLRQ
jgi:two-component system secretion response regulator SsrB